MGREALEKKNLGFISWPTEEVHASLDPISRESNRRREMVGSVKGRANSLCTSAYTERSQSMGERYAKDIRHRRQGQPLVTFQPEMTRSENIKPTGPVPSYLSPASSTAAFSTAISVLTISQFLDCTMFLLTSRILISLEYFYYLSRLHTSYQNDFRKPYIAPQPSVPCLTIQH